MPATEIIAAGTMAALIQGLQAWIALARISGLTEAQINEIFNTEFTEFQANIPGKLPDA